MNKIYTPSRLVAVASLLLASGGAAWGQAATFGSATTTALGALSRPEGVAVADVNNDGRPDALLVASGALKVLLGNGAGGFALQGSPASTGGRGTVVPTDANGDGQLDALIVARAALTVLLGNGAGGFASAGASIATGGNPLFLATADVNGDGKPDVLAANGNGTLGVLLGTGVSTNSFVLQANPPATGGGAANYVAAADVNGDSKPDALVANSNGTLSVLLGDGAGGFVLQAASPGTGGSLANSLAVADVNGDGQLDALVANDNRTLGVLLGNGLGGFVLQASPPITTTTTSATTQSVKIADANGDGRPDALVLNDDSRLSVLLGNGAGSFTLQKTNPAPFATGGPDASSLAVADVNGDGKPDALVTNSASSQLRVDGTLGVLLNTTTFRAPTITSFAPASGPVGRTVTVRGSYLSNIRSIRFGGLRASTFSTNASGTILTVQVPVLATSQRISVTTAGGSALTSTAFQVTRTSPSLLYAQVPDLQAGAGNYWAPTVTDLDNNGLLDLLVGNQNGYVERYEQQAGTGVFIDVATLKVGAAFLNVGSFAAPTVADLDGDGLLDLLVGNADGKVEHYEQQGARSANFVSLGKFTALPALPATGGTPQIIDVGDYATPVVTDLDGDGLLDLLVGNADGKVARFEPPLAQVRDFKSQANLQVGGSDLDVGAYAAPAVSDLDGNGQLDLLVGDVNGYLHLYQQAGTNALAFADVPAASFPLATQQLGGNATPFVTDLDGDGLLDLLVGNMNGTVAHFVQTEVFAPTSFSPAANALAVPGNSPVTATFNQPLAASPAPVLRVFGNRRGGRTGAAVASANTLTYTPPAGQEFAAGEVVFSTVAATSATNGLALPRPLVAQFTAAVGGTGRGNFPTSSFVGVGAASTNPGPQGLAVADVNNDGRADLLTANYSTNTVSVRLSTGPGTFAASGQEIPVGNNPTRVVVGDLNLDGLLDLVTTNSSAGTLSVRLGTSSGGTISFAATGLNPIVGPFPRGVVLADANGDGYLDILAANFGNTTVSVLLNNGSSTLGFSNAPGISMGSLPYDLAVGDVNGDGALDLLTADYGGGTASVRLGNGDGTFATTGATLAAGNSPQSLTLGDLNGDGLLDLAVANTGAGTVSVFLQASPGGLPLTATSTLPAGTYPDAVVLGDVDADGDLDLAVTNFGSDNANLYINDGAGAFAAPATNPTVATGTGPQALALADVDNDGDLDLLVANQTTNNVVVRRNEPLLTPTLTLLNPSSGPLDTNVTGSGANLAGLSSVLVGGVPATVSGTATAGQVSFIIPRQASTGRVVVATPAGQALGPVFTVTRPSTSNRFPGGEFLTVPVGTPLQVSSYVAPVVTDLDGNGLLDLLVGTHDGQLVRYEQAANNSAYFYAQPNLQGPEGDLSIESGALAITDLDGNGRLDLLVGDGGNIHRFEQQLRRGLRFVDRGLLTAADGTTALDVAGQFAAAPTITDLDGNGLLDLLVGNYDGNLLRFEQTAPLAATFAAQPLTVGGAAYTAPGSYAHPVLTDLDSDGLLDMLVGTSTSNLLRLEQASPGSSDFTDLGNLTTDGTAPVAFYYGAPAITDLDGDGLLDILVGNSDGNFLRFEQSVAAPLPVKLTAFTATAQGPAAVSLAWATASETNSARFEVERSADGARFAAIGQVAGAGTSSAAHVYNLLDNFLPTGANLLYYRLRQVDQDGTATYSPVRTVALSGAAGLSLYPNPARTVATLTGAAPGTRVRVLDALGRPVATAAADAAGTAQLRLPAGLAPGVYVVQGGPQVLRLVVE